MNAKTTKIPTSTLKAAVTSFLTRHVERAEEAKADLLRRMQDDVIEALSWHAVSVAQQSAQGRLAKLVLEGLNLGTQDLGQLYTYALGESLRKMQSVATTRTTGIIDPHIMAAEGAFWAELVELLSK